MEQGTGKTLVTIAFFQYLHEAYGFNRFVVICPLTVIDVWIEQIKQHWDPHGFTYVVPSGLGEKLPTNGPLFAFYNYEKVGRGSYKQLQKLKFDVAVADESHRIKNHASKQSKRCARVEAPIRMILTGTPVGNSPIDLFGQFKFLDPRALGKEVGPFRDRFCRKGGYMNLKWVFRKHKEPELMRIINRYAYRITRKEALGMEDGITLKRVFDLDRHERDFYDELVEEMCVSSKDFTVTTPLVVSQLMKLRQITGGFVKDDEGANQRIGSSKLKALEDYLRHDWNRDERLAIFCVFTEEINQISDLLRKMKFKFGTISGSVEREERKRHIDAFHSGALDGMLSQVAAGGVGIDLTPASTSIFFSVDFSFINYYQARARIDRHGQRRKTAHVHFLAKNTIDISSYNALLEKEDVAARVLAHLRKHRRQ